MFVTPRSSMKSFVSVSIWLGTSLKFVRSRLPARVSVAIQPVSEASEITKGDSSTTSSVRGDVDVGGGRACASPMDIGKKIGAASANGIETDANVLMGLRGTRGQGAFSWGRKTRQGTPLFWGWG